MEKIEIVATKDFIENYGYYGYEELVRKVLHNCANKKDLGLIGKLTITGSEPSARVFFTNENGDDFTVRYFIRNENDKEWSASYTLYKQVDDGDGSSHGEDLSHGIAKTHYVLTAEDIAEIERQNKVVKIAPVVTSAKVTDKASSFCNTSYVDFTLTGSDSTFCIKYYDKVPVSGAIYPHPELYKFTEIPHDDENVTQQILKILKESNQSLYDDNAK